MRTGEMAGLDRTERIDAGDRSAVGQEWGTLEIKALKDSAHLGARRAAFLLGRSLCSVKMAAHRYRISLRVTKRGVILGQPRGETWKTSPLRTAVLACALDITTAEQRIVSDLKNPLPLCPSCGVNPARKTETGMCRPCHLKRLTRQLEEIAAERRALREYQTAKQHAHRAKECRVEGCDRDANGNRGMCYTHSRLARRETS